MLSFLEKVSIMKKALIAGVIAQDGMFLVIFL